MGTDDDALRDVDGKLLVDSQGKKLVKSRRLEGHDSYDSKVEVSLDEYVRQLPPSHRARLEYEQLMATIELQSLVTGVRVKVAR